MTARIETQCAVIGAGAVGLAIARSLAVRGLEVVVVEAANAIGAGISSRNSEVIHAGLYYAPGSLKAQLCIEGKERLYRYCQSRAIAHRPLGKLIVATDEAQRPALTALQAQAVACGVTDLVALTSKQVQAIEPQVRCTAALLSPSTGIVDSHGLMQSLHAEAQAAGAMIAFNTPVHGGQAVKDGLELDCGGADPVRLYARLVVNAAGLGAQAISRALLGLPVETIPPLYYAKGNYFALAGRSPFLRLVYPLPQKAGLGVHVTLDLAGQARFGPDVEWVDVVDYSVDPSRSGPFYAAIRRYWPGLPDGALQPAYAGIRPKLVGPGQDAADFCLHGPERHGIVGLVCLYGIESPGLTAALAIAERVANALAKEG